MTIIPHLFILRCWQAVVQIKKTVIKANYTCFKSITHTYLLIQKIVNHINLFGYKYQLTLIFVLCLVVNAVHRYDLIIFFVNILHVNYKKKIDIFFYLTVIGYEGHSLCTLLNNYFKCAQIFKALVPPFDNIMFVYDHILWTQLCLLLHVLECFEFNEKTTQIMNFVLIYLRCILLLTTINVYKTYNSRLYLNVYSHPSPQQRSFLQFLPLRPLSN